MQFHDIDSGDAHRIPNRCTLYMDLKPPYRIGKVQDFVPHIISFSKDFSIQMFVIKLSLLLIPILSEVKKKGCHYILVSISNWGTKVIIKACLGYV